ncbi:PREDICTED: uncharacterized protein LOC106328882 isoform X1 [Brassica oleracea var. oleracea]|uniref:Zinc finger GRF-type domain-containing protein n=2 Tax=Brassica oleracea var. oleracea TaxID=109376 RepID=A0A0D3B2P1_BRAOL|nr:PREDICTED: uncharacterized protein LOC106328882 isoform X1 [Brassica oleracea var. oleracea]XP_013622872.1 PREDICTED: uncharacterized protein LOC106328882 isoform X1 [Brassica oleracea var. oleracea]
MRRRLPGDFLHLSDHRIYYPRAQMDPAEDRSHAQRQDHHINMLGFLADSEYGIPRRCPCGGRLINEVRGIENHDTLPGKRFFTCINYEADGFHYRQPWVIGMQEELERLTQRVEEAEQVIMGIPKLTKQIETLEEQVKFLTDQVYELTVQIANLENVCFD